MTKSIKIFLGVISVLMLSIGCKSDLYQFNGRFNIPAKSSESPIVQFIQELDNYTAELERENLGKAFEYTKIPYSYIPVKEFNENIKLAPTARLLVLDQTLGLKDNVIDSLLTFVAKGGSILFTKPIQDERLGFFYGFEANANWKTNIGAEGYYMKKPIFPDREKFSYSNNAVHLGFEDTNFSASAEVLVTASNDMNYPVVTRNKIGKGQVLLYNSFEQLNKSMRGFIFSCSLMALEGVPYPIANVATIFLDDFPSPTYGIYKEPIKSEMNLTVTDYVNKVWWPDMKKLAKEENIKYTAYVTFDYNADVVPPYTFKEWDRNKITVNNIAQSSSAWIGRDVLSSGHELGFHGYNHVSLLKSDWPNPDYMVTALKSADKKWKTANFKDLPKSYVPPSNYIDSTGLAKLSQGMPSLKYMQSTYLGEFEEGGLREFDPDPYNNHFFDFPRISSGYVLAPTNEWEIESMYMCTGIWTHFVHPDDVYQIPDESNAKTSGHFEYRNKFNLNWYSSGSKKGMLDRFKDHISEYKKRHPNTRFLNATESSEITVKWRNNYYSHSNYDGLYEVEGRKDTKRFPDHYWLMYVSSENVQQINNVLNEEGISYEKRKLLNGFLYSVKTRDSQLTIPDLNPKLPVIFEDKKSIVAQVLTDRQVFEKNKNLLMPFAERISRYVAEDNLKAASDLLQNQFRTSSKVNIAMVKEYAQYMVWQGKEKELWQVLNDYYNRFESSDTSKIHRYVLDVTSYLDSNEQEKWLERELYWDTDNTAVLKEYIQNFNTKENYQNINKSYKKLIALEPSNTLTKTYAKFLIDNKSDEVVPFLNTIAPCAISDKDLAFAIAWAYADRLVFEKALLWAKCAQKINQETLDFWVLNSNSFEEKKETDFPYYIKLLLANDTKKAYQELRNVSPCYKGLENEAVQIAYNFADFGAFAKALEWSECGADVPVEKRMEWYYETNQLKELKQVYKEHLSKNPKDYKIKNHMATLMLYSSDVLGAAEIVMGMPLNKVDSNILKAIDREVKEMDLKQQTTFYKLYIELLEPSTTKEIVSRIRENQGNEIGFETFNINDAFRPTALMNGVYFKLRNENGNFHRIALTQSSMYKIPPDSIFRPNNEGRDLLGVEYGYYINSKENKNAWLRGRLERDTENKIYYQFGAGYSISKKLNFTSFQLDAFPVRTGPGHVLDIYRIRFNGYKEIALGKAFTNVLSLESNYYTDNEFETTGLLRFQYALVNNKKFKISPLLETSYGYGTSNRRDGFPYWIADDRLVGGGGVLFTIGSPLTNFQFTTDISLFAERGQPNFERYTGQLSYKIKKFTQLNAAFEVYTIEDFFSNVFQLGLGYRFK